MAALPPRTRWSPSPPALGAAGRKLQARYVSTVSEDVLRAFAYETLRAKRLRPDYLAALRVVLGNQAHAERHRYDLEMNHRVPFASERTMRTIIDQMRAAGETEDRPVRLGNGRFQTIQCFAAGEPRTPLVDATHYGTTEDAEELERRWRSCEGVRQYSEQIPPDLTDDHIPCWSLAA